MNTEGIWIANYYLFIIEMVCYSNAHYHHGTGHLNTRLLFKWWSEYWSVNQMVIWIRNYHCTWHLNSTPFNKLTNLHYLKSKLVRYSDPTVVVKVDKFSKVNPPFFTTLENPSNQSFMLFSITSTIPNSNLVLRAYPFTTPTYQNHPKLYPLFGATPTYHNTLPRFPSRKSCLNA